MASELPAHPENRDLGLDGLRGLAMVMVLLAHFIRLAPGQGVLGDALILMGRAGWVGIDIFFTLSGFLITRILLQARGGKRGFGVFYARRALRTVPVFAVVLIGVLHIGPAVLPRDEMERLWLPQGPASPLWYWTYTSNIAVAWAGDFFHRLLGVTWSLAVEEQFYLTWPFLVFLTPRRYLGRICIVIFGSALALRAGLLWGGASDEAVYVLMPCRMDTLAGGAALALWAKEGRLAQIWPIARRLLPVCVAIMVGLIAWIWIDRHEDRHRESLFLEDPRMQTVGYSAMAALAVMMVWGAWRAPRDGRCGRFLRSPILLAFGRYSYAIYLGHMIVVFGLERTLMGWCFEGGGHIEGGLSWAAQAVFLPAAGLISFGVGALSWHFFEAPILKLKRYLRYEAAEPRTDSSRPAERSSSDTTVEGAPK